MRPTEPFRQEHEELRLHIEHLGQAARQLPELTGEEREVVVGRVLGFLRDTLVPHARAEEQVLYPEWARLVGYPDAAVPMIHDHEAIVERIELLADTGIEDVGTLQELLFGLSALIGVHFRKEEDLQLPVFDAAPPELTRDVLERMEALAGHAHAHSHS